MSFIIGFNSEEFDDLAGDDPRLDPDGYVDDDVDVFGASASADELAADEGNPIAYTPEQRRQLKELVSQAMAGVLPRTRDLKSWEPNKLNARHIQIVMMKATGMRNQTIAELLGVGEVNVSVVINHPDAQYLLATILSMAAEKITDIPARVEAHANEALNVVLKHMRNGKEETASRNAFKLLEIAGYGATKKVDMNVKHNLEVPAKQAGQLATALREARDITELSRVTMHEAESAGGESADSVTVGKPPLSSHQTDNQVDDQRGVA